MKFRFNSQKFPVRILLFFVVGVIILSPVLYTGSLKAGQNPRSLFLQHCNSPAEAVPVPTVKDESLAAQKDFCNRLRAQHDGLPSSISVSWSNRQTQNMWDLSMLEEFESNLDDPNRAVLQKVDGIMGAQGTFSMYIFDNQNGQSDIVSSSLKNSKTWERNEIDKLLQQLQLFADRNNLSRSETYLVDIGSNIGYFSLSAAAAGFQVIAVEAMSVNQFAMRMSICANEEIGLSQAITLIPVALSFQNIHCDLFSAGFNALDGFIRCGSPEQLEALTASTGSIKRQDIEVARLDDVLKDWIPSLAGRVGALN